MIGRDSGRYGKIANTTLCSELALKVFFPLEFRTRSSSFL